MGRVKQVGVKGVGFELETYIFNHQHVLHAILKRNFEGKKHMNNFG
jgi:hypothetical protein